MNAELLLEHFHRLGDAPDAVPRLRRFILDLAVRGKLVEQEKDDETASDLLKRLRVPCVNEAGLYEIPKNWAWIRCASLMHERGETINPERHPDEEFVLWSVPSFATGKPEIVLGRDIGASKPSIDPGVILISRINPHLNRVWVTKAIPGYRHIASSEWIVLKPSGLLPDFLKWSLRSPFFFEQFCSVLTGIGGSLTRVRSADAAEYLLALPPLPEQHRIVAKVEELMALCDSLEAAQQQREQQRARLTAAAWQGVVQAEDQGPARFALGQLPALTTRPAQVKALRQTILDLAVRGRLVPQDERDEPAGRLLEKLSIGPAGDEPFALPSSWAWVETGVISEARLGKMLDRAKNTGTMRRYLRNINVRWYDFDLSDVHQTPMRDEELGDLLLKNGDVLICEGGEPGRAAVWNGRVENMYFQKALHRVRFPKGVNPTFFTHTIKQSADEGRLAAYFTGVGIKHFTGRGLASYIFPLPPLAEQVRIVAKVDELMALCDALEAALQAGEELKAKALEAVLRAEATGTDAPPPVRVRQLQAPQPRTPRYAEAEVELAVAAEPAVHPGALQAVVRRGPGRPPKSGALTTTAARAIEGFLSAHPGWHGKSAILAATGTDAAAWNAAIKELLEGGKVERQGEKKGARYGSIEQN